MMKAFILAAGEGVRLRPLTCDRPKPMLEVAGKPILARTVEAVISCGIKKIVLLVGYKQETVRSYFGTVYDGAKIDYIFQEKREGTAHAVAHAENSISEPFICINGDVLISEADMRGALDLFKKTGKTVMAVTRVEHPERFGVVEETNGKFERIVEKPKEPKTNLINAGLFVFTPEIFDEIRKTEKSARGEYEITDTLNAFAEKHEIRVYLLKNYWIDVGAPDDLHRAGVMLQEKL